MCLPVVPYVAMAASAVLAKQKIDLTNKAVSNQIEASNAAAEANYSALIDRSLQVNEAHAQDAFQRKIQGLRERGRLAVIQADAGVGGKSSLRVLNNAILQESMDVEVTDSNASYELSQIQREVDSVAATNEGEVNAAASKSISPLHGLMQLGVAAGEGYETGSELSKAFSDLKRIPNYKHHRADGLH